MEIEIWLELSRAEPDDHEKIEKRFRDWYEEGAEIRYGKACFGRLTEMDGPDRYRVDLGDIDPISAIRDLHARLYRFGVKVYIHFLP